MSGLLRIPQSGFVFGGGGGGSGGDPTGVPLGPYANWAALPVSGTAGALATVTSIGPGNATGTAIWSGTEWQLYRGIFDSVADLNAFAEPIQTGGVGSVEETGDTNENQVVYVYDGAAWARSAALSTGYVWTLSDLYDFSAVGLRDGDLGLWTPSGSAPITLRYKSACSFAGGGTRPAWVTVTAYAGTPILQAWTDGTESNVTLAAQGWTVVNDPGGTVTATGGFQRLSITSASPAAARLRCLIGTLAAGTRVEALHQVRGDLGTGLANMYLPFIADGTNCTVFGQCIAVAGLGFGAPSLAGPLQTPLRNNTAPALPTLGQTAATILVRDEGATVLDSAARDGLPLGDYRRNLQVSGANLLQISATRENSGTSTLDYRGQVVTY